MILGPGFGNPHFAEICRRQEWDLGPEACQKKGHLWVLTGSTSPYGLERCVWCRQERVGESEYPP